MNINEGVAVSRAVISAGLLIASGYMAVQGVTGWGWFLFCSILIFPSQINVDFRESGNE
jgi:hypothetical protein